MEIAAGYYLNLFDHKQHSWDEGRDIFIIFNEPNIEPTKEELDVLIELVEKELEKVPTGESLEDAILNSGLECVTFGIQIRAEGLKPRSLDQQILNAAGKTELKKSSTYQTFSR